MYRWQDPAPPAVAMIRSRRMRQLFIQQHGAWSHAPAVPTMVIDGSEYVEQAGMRTCNGCAFEDNADRCETADKLSSDFFGANCDARSVIYIRKA